MATIGDGDGGEEGASEGATQTGDGVLTVGTEVHTSDGDMDSDSEASAAEAAQRRVADVQVYGMLRDAGFDGPRWNSYCSKHGKTALAKFDQWIGSGWAFVQSAKIGHPVAVNDEWARNILRNDRLHREVLAGHTVFLGLRSWKRRQGDPQRAWRADGPLSLADSVIDVCKFEFSNAFSRWRNEVSEKVPVWATDHEQLGVIEHGMAERDKPAPLFPDPLATVVTDDLLTRALDGLDPVFVRIAQLHAQGLGYEEIGRAVDRTRRQVEYVLHEVLPRRDIRSQLEGEQA